MSNILRVMRVVDADGKPIGVNCWVWCPGCNGAHQFTVESTKDAPLWDWNRSEDRPTFSPSYLAKWTDADGEHRCHSYLRDGVWEFLGDSTHMLAGQKVPAVPLPDWLAKT